MVSTAPATVQPTVSDIWAGYQPGLASQGLPTGTRAGPGPYTGLQHRGRNKDEMWICFCREPVASYHKACVACGRNEEGGFAPAHEIPWRCSQDGHVNKANHENCGKVIGEEAGQKIKCWAARSTALPTGADFRANDWICPQCERVKEKKMVNFAREHQCRWCQATKEDLAAGGWQIRLVRDWPEGTKFDSDRK